MTTIIDVLGARAERLNEPVQHILAQLGIDAQYYIAGNSLNGWPVNDIDVYTSQWVTADFVARTGYKVLHETPSAITIKHTPPIQLCRYWKNTLKELVASFDFSHIQVGAEFVNGKRNGLYYTHDWLVAGALGTTKYVGSEYPVSSLLRLVKYANRKHPRVAIRMSILHILCDILRLGDLTYEEFKVQMDAIDIAMWDGSPFEKSELSKLALTLFALLNDQVEAD